MPHAERRRSTRLVAGVLLAALLLSSLAPPGAGGASRTLPIPRAAHATTNAPRGSDSSPGL
ncbi:MAG: hypothetical protein ACREC5_00355, partial [Thermoplasmata archaeon]